MKTKALYLCLLLLAGCAYLGVPVPETYSERLAAGYVGVTTVREATLSGLEAGYISVDDAKNIQATADTIRGALDVARTLDDTAAESKLDAALIMLTELQKYVASRNKP